MLSFFCFLLTTYLSWAQSKERLLLTILKISVNSWLIILCLSPARHSWPPLVDKRRWVVSPAPLNSRPIGNYSTGVIVICLFTDRWQLTADCWLLPNSQKNDMSPDPYHSLAWSLILISTIITKSYPCLGSFRITLLFHNLTRFSGMGFAQYVRDKSCVITGLSVLTDHPDFLKACFGDEIGGGHFTNLLLSVEQNKIKFINRLSFIFYWNLKGRSLPKPYG